jgi:hypothetical protein
MRRPRLARTGGRIGVMRRFAMPVTAAATLLVLIVAIANGFSPRQELWLLVVPLALGLLVGPLAQQVTGWSAHRFAQPVAAFAVLLILTLWLPSCHSPGGPVPLWVVVFLLGLGLLAEPLAQVASGLPAYGYAQSVAALAAMLVMFWILSIDSEVIDRLPLGSLRVVLVLLSFVLVTGQLERRPGPCRFLQLPATIAALAYLLLTLASPPVSGISPEWPRRRAPRRSDRTARRPTPRAGPVRASQRALTDSARCARRPGDRAAANRARYT